MIADLVRGVLDVLPAIALRDPWWLLLVPGVWALLWWWRRPGVRHARLRAYADPHLLKWVAVAPRRDGLPWLTLLGWMLIAVAISGPYLVDRDREPPRHGLDLAVVIDISPSMRVGDVAPNRLSRARLELDDFLHRLDDGDRVTLIAFSAHAYRLMPLTGDTALVSWYLEALDPSLTRHHGSNVIPALEQAARTLGQDRALDNRAIVLVSDGEFPDEAAVQATAGRLAESGIPIFALGIGTPTGGPVPMRDGYLRDAGGETVVSRLDRSLLERIAADTGGRYSDVLPDDRDWDHLFEGLETLARESRTVPLSAQGTPLFPWLLAFGLLLLLVARPGGPRPATAHAAALAPVIAIAALLVLAPTDGLAAPWSPERQAFAALEAGEYAEAERLYRGLDGYRGRLGHGAALYRLQRWDAALEAFAAAEQATGDDRERARALYNRANALARLERFDEALAAYDRALALHPNHARAALNRGLVQRAKARSMPALEDEDDPPEHERETAREFRPGLAEDERAAGDATDSSDIEPQPGITGPPTQRRVIGRPRPGDGAPADLRRFDSVDDDAREVLRHRFTLMDATRPRSQEAQPW